MPTEDDLCWAYLGMGWDVGTTGTNLGQLAICSWTFMQEDTCTLILASVTWEERGQGQGAGAGSLVPDTPASTPAEGGRCTQGCGAAPRSRRSQLTLWSCRGPSGSSPDGAPGELGDMGGLFV